MTIARTLTVTLAALTASSFAFTTLANATAANGKWRRSNGAIIQAFDCGGGLGRKGIKAPEAHKVGKTIMCGAKAAGANKWKGSLLNLDNNQKYSGTVTLKGSSLSLSGCVLGGIICSSDTWARAN